MTWQDTIPRAPTLAGRLLQDLMLGRWDERFGLNIQPSAAPYATAVSIPLLPDRSLRLPEENAAAWGAQLRLMRHASKDAYDVTVSWALTCCSHFVRSLTADVRPVRLLDSRELECIRKRLPNIMQEGELWKELLQMRTFVKCDQALPLQHYSDWNGQPSMLRLIARNNELRQWGLHPGDEGKDALFALMAIGERVAPVPEAGYITQYSLNDSSMRLRAYSRLINPVKVFGTRTY